MFLIENCEVSMKLPHKMTDIRYQPVALIFSVFVFYKGIGKTAPITSFIYIPHLILNKVNFFSSFCSVWFVLPFVFKCHSAFLFENRFLKCIKAEMTKLYQICLKCQLSKRIEKIDNLPIKSKPFK